MEMNPACRLRILVAEDNVVNKLVICSILEKIGLGAEMAFNGLEALEACRARTFDIIFMDCQMPVMDGYTASHRIRLMERKRKQAPVFIVAMTADGLTANKAKCLEAGMDDFLTKPVMIGDLQAMLLRAGSGMPAEATAEPPLDAKPTLPFQVLDLAILNRLRSLSEEGEDGFFPQLISDFLAQSSEKLGKLGECSGLGDFESMAKLAHGLKGLSLNFGALAMTRNCDALQSAAEARDASVVSEILARLETALADTRAALSKWGATGVDVETGTSNPAGVRKSGGNHV